MNKNNYNGEQIDKTIELTDSGLFTEPIVQISSLYYLNENEAKLLLDPPNILKLAINFGIAVVGYSMNEVITETSKLLSSKPIIDVLKALYTNPFSSTIWKLIIFSVITLIMYCIGKFFPREYCQLVRRIKEHFKIKKPMNVLRKTR